MCKFVLEGQISNTNAIRHTIRITEFSKYFPKKNIVVEDLSNGSERFPVRVVNDVDDSAIDKFVYTTRVVDRTGILAARNNDMVVYCLCIGDCLLECQCSSGVYDNKGHIRGPSLDWAFLECSSACACSMRCGNRVAQKGATYAVEIYRTCDNRGWAVRALRSIPCGAFIGEYTGELLNEFEANERSDSYLFETAVGENNYTIDARLYGNFTRFINHSCEPNAKVGLVVWDSQVEQLSHICIFATRNISKGEEITISYGENWWGTKVTMNVFNLEVFDTKNPTRTLIILDGISGDDSILEIKKRIAQRNQKLTVERQSIRLEPRGKAVTNDRNIKDLGLSAQNAQLYLKDLGPQIAWKTVFLMEYAGPFFIYPIFYFRPSVVYGSDVSGDINLAVTLACLCWLVHYAKRLFETQFIHRFSNGTMPRFNLFKNCCYYWGFSAFVSYFVNHPLFTPPLFGSTQIYLGLIGFAISEFGNFSIHILLRNLRSEGTHERRIPFPDGNPMSLLFNLVSCPNYTYEVTAWLCFSFMVQSLPNVKLFVRDNVSSKIQHLLETSLFKFDCLAVEVICIPRENEDWGTADVLRYYAAKINKDFIVISDDFISDANLHPMVDQFRAHKAKFSCLLSEYCVTGLVPGPKIKRSKGSIFLYILGGCISFSLFFQNFNFISTINKKQFNHQNIFPHINTIKCMTYIVPRVDASIIARANNIGAYFEVNKAILKSLSRISLRICPGRSFDFKTTGISSGESLVANDAEISSRVVLKRSLIGDKCHIGEKTRVQGSLIMEEVRIGKCVNISQSIICPGVEIEDNAEVINCIVVCGQKITAKCELWRSLDDLKVLAKVQDDIIEADDNSEWTTG
uniref:SET domain-containing protein n=1 Tax=Heterorhabditis bacteriophora TaxID=37862 RepID=A0A1I7X9A7_HETBA